MGFYRDTELFDIDINHGEGGTAKNRMKSELRKSEAFTYAIVYVSMQGEILSYGVCK
jgi:hypothetical protein